MWQCIAFFFLYIQKFKFTTYNIYHIPMQKIKGKQQWTQEQKKLLADLFPKFSSKKWKMISLEMAQNGFKRTQLECREKWINFLDPNLNNKDWSSQQLERLYNFHDKYGTRWCFMQKELNRTQNKIKNRFYGTIRNYIRLVLNTLCQRHTCFNTEINKISPSLLNDLYNSENIFDFLRGEIKKMIYRMKFKIDKKILRNRIREKQNLYRELLGLIGSLFKGSFSLRFFDKIEKSQSNDYEEDKQEEESIKQISKQFFVGENKIIKKQQCEIKQKQQNQEQNLNLVSPIAQNIQSIGHFSLDKNENIEQNNENIKQQQNLYAKNNIQKPDLSNPNQNNKNMMETNQHYQMGHVYPFLDHHQAMMAHQQWIIHQRYRDSLQYQYDYENIIDKIRYQNLLMIHQQQDFLIKQFINQVNIGEDKINKQNT